MHEYTETEVRWQFVVNTCFTGPGCSYLQRTIGKLVHAKQIK